MHPAPPVTTLPRELRPYLDLLNQVFEIDKKASALTESNSIQRNVRNMRTWFERDITATQGQGGQQVVYSLTFHNPIGEPYNETRADCDASIAGSGTEHLMITDVMKPIVWLSVGGAPKVIVQQAVVMVESSQPTTPDVETQALAVGASVVFDGTGLVKTAPDPAEPVAPAGLAADAPLATDAPSTTDSTQPLA